ncbi:MAG TPA: VWA domain-containing protein, partial [Thermoanaerobaculia bacterium]
MTKYLALPALLLVIAFAATADQKSETPKSLAPLVEKVNVSVINVDVTVTSRTGQPAMDLKPADFEVFEDGKPQTITNFYVVDHAVVRQEGAGAPAATQTTSDTHFRRKAVLLIDNHFVDKRRRDECLRELRKFIQSDYAGEYDWSIGVIGGGVHMILPFTADKAAINAVLDNVIARGTIAPVAQVTPEAIADPSQRVVGGGERGDAAAASALASAMVQRRAEVEAEVDRDFRFLNALDAIRASARAVIDACRALSPMDGKKLIVLVTGGMEIDNRTADPRSLSSFSSPGDHDREAADIRESMAREANAANVNLYLINAVGTASPVLGFDTGQGNPATALGNDVRNLDSFPSALARETGGMYLTSNTLADSIRTIDTVSSTFYSIGYKPSHFEDGKYHSITVRLKKPGYVVRSRSGYVDESNDTRFEEAMKVALSTAVPQGLLPVHVEVGRGVPKGEYSIVPVTASMPLKRLTTIRNGDKNSGRVHVYISVFDQTDANVGYHHAVQDFQLTDAQLRDIENFRYTMKVDLHPGLYRAVVVLRDDVTDEV